MSDVSTQDSGDGLAVCPPKLREGYPGGRLLQRSSKHIGAGQKLVDEVATQLLTVPVTQGLTFVAEVSTILVQHDCASTRCVAILQLVWRHILKPTPVIYGPGNDSLQQLISLE